MVTELLAELGVARHLVMGIVLAGLLVLESYLPEMVQFSRGQRWRHDSRNLGLALLNGLLGVLLMGPALAGVSTIVSSREWGLAPLLGDGFGQWLAILLIFDLWMYVWHRLNHELPILWRLHRVHHSDVAMDASTALRFHPVEILLSGLMRLLLMPLLGMTLAHLLVYELILLPIILVQHANVKSPKALDRFVRLLVVTPWMHRIHHSCRRRETNSNYGSVLTIWDRLFGSWCWRDDPEAIKFGLEEWRDDNSQTVAGMLRTPIDDRPPGRSPE